MTHRALLLFLALTACHASPRKPATPDARVEAAVARWSAALRSGNNDRLMAAEDHGGQFALAYGVIKTAASHVPDGTDAVESTMTGIVGLTLLQLIAPGIFGPPFETFYAVLPTGPLGPPLVQAGLATQRADGKIFAIVPLPWDKTIGRLDEAAQRHTVKLRERAAWTCRPTSIEGAVRPSARPLVAMAQVSQNIFADWLRGVEALWLVRAECDGGPALFVVTAGLDGNDRILLATGPRTVDELRGQRAPALANTAE